VSCGRTSAVWRQGDRVQVRLRVTPRSSVERMEGPMETAEGPAIRTKVRAAPTDNKANEAVVRLVAGIAGRPPSAVTILAGATSRIKTLAISGNPDEVERALKDLAGTTA
jgi:uncharacterized protein YggU (UPF0235/DUF167 family)